jgi:sensor histidine kinase regulating citrate/malate metabolism
MDESKLYSAKIFVEESYELSKCYEYFACSQGHPFSMSLDVREGNYPDEFNENEKYAGEMMVTELITNALKSVFRIKDISKIHKETYNKSIFKKVKPFVNIKLQEDGKIYLIEVTDNGPGIIEEDMPHIWEDGFSRRGSTGVGLSGLKERIEDVFHGSAVARSQPYVDTTFTITIPKIEG